MGVSDSENWRVFVALDAPPAALSDFEKLRNALRASPLADLARWSETARPHITLRFAAHFPAAAIDELRARLADAASQMNAFAVVLMGVMLLPNARRPRALCVGARPSRELAALRAAVNAAFEPFQVAERARVDAADAFKPHITIGRPRREARFDAAALAEIERLMTDNLTCRRFDATEFALYRSVLTRRAALHENLGRYALKQP